MFRCDYGFRVRDSPWGERRLTDAAAAFTGHAACDPKAELHRECFLSAFQFCDDFRKHLETNDTTKGFNGHCHARWLWFDLDRNDLSIALKDARRLTGFIFNRYELQSDDLLIFFSGSKGFHVGLPLSLCGTLEPSRELNRVCRQLAEDLASAAGVVIDSAVFDKVRLFRAPNSRHSKTNLHKRRLSYDELHNLPVQAIVELAREPEPFDIPCDPPANAQAERDWSEATASMARQKTAVRRRKIAHLVDGSSLTLNRGTLDFIRNGATIGDRALQLFSSAANLAELNCPPELAHALLTESALDSGLPPNEVRRQIDCGHSHGSGANS